MKRGITKKRHKRNKTDKAIEMRKSIRDRKNKDTSDLWLAPKGSGKFLISTGSTLVDLAISGRRFIGGGIPVGIFCEIFGDSARGKTVMLLEIAGIVQRMGGDYLFIDPEARVNKEFAQIFGFSINNDKYKKPDTVAEAFDLIRSWKPKGPGPHVVFVDSLAAFESKEESQDKGDEYSGARKAKEFSTELRKSTRLIEKNDYLVIATNQTRQVMGATQYQKKTKSTGGNAPKFYASLRLELMAPNSEGKVKMEKTIKGVLHKRDVGVQTKVFIEKSTVSTPYQNGLMRILFDYGVDDIVPNLRFLKKNTKAGSFVLDGEKIGHTLTDAVEYIESNDLEEELQEEVTELWTEIQKALTPKRKRKVR